MKRLVTSAALIAVLVCAGSALAHGSTVRVSGVQAPVDKTAGAPGDPCAAVDPETGKKGSLGMDVVSVTRFRARVVRVAGEA
jgi:hypothetical protein